MVILNPRFFRHLTNHFPMLFKVPINHGIYMKWRRAITTSSSLKENISISYNVAESQAVTEINRDLKDITANLGITEKVETMTSMDAFITLKDHKENFLNKPKCRLINPAKSNLGLVSKQILGDINKTVRSTVQANQWRKSADAIEWFKELENKTSISFVVFDIVEFYLPSQKTCYMKH